MTSRTTSERSMAWMPRSRLYRSRRSRLDDLRRIPAVSTNTTGTPSKISSMSIVGCIGLVGGHDEVAALDPGGGFVAGRLPRMRGRGAQHARDVAVDRRQALAHVDEEDDDVSLVDGDLRLGLDRRTRRILCP